ncbi:MAG: hypothetical protein ACREJQ_03865 [bacterium]
MSKCSKSITRLSDPRRNAYKGLIWGGVMACLLISASPALAFKLSPQGTVLERKLSRVGVGLVDKITQSLALRGIEHFTEPVHEEITQRIYGCEGDAEVCADPDLGFASPFVVAGVRWNDDPPFRLNPGQGRDLHCKVEETIRIITQPWCWGGLFRDAKRRAERGELMDAASGVSLLHRSHFGDLQFMHAMATKDGEPAETTRRKILMWAEFTWRTAMKEYGLATRLQDISIEGFNDHFGRTEWRVQDLFTLGNIALRQRMHEVAFGSLLHMVQDSFARGHIDRAEPILGETCPGPGKYAKPGVIREFHAYGNQDTGKHADYDSRHAFARHMSAERPNVIDVGRVLKEMFERGQAWETVKPYLECIFEAGNPAAKASPGDAFTK